MSSVEERTRQVILGIALAGVVCRVALVWQLGLTSRVETFEYEEVARNIIEGSGFGITHHGAWYRSYASIPYVALTVLVYTLVGRSHAAMLAVQAMISAPVALAAGLLALRVFGARAAVIAATLAALHPALVYVDTHKLHPLGLDAALATGGLALALDMAPRLSRAGALGLWHGVAILERPPFSALAAIALARWRRPLASSWPVVIVYGLCVALPSAAWAARNVGVYGEPLLNPEDGELLWKGNNPQASGTNLARGDEGIPVFDAAPEAFRRKILAADEAGQRRMFRKAALDFVLGQPSAALRLYAVKLGSFFWFSEHAGRLYPAHYMAVYRLFYAALLAFSAMGLARALARPGEGRRDAIALCAFFSSVGALQALFYVETRHRFAVEPLLCVLAAGGLAALARSLSARPRAAS